MIRTFVLIGACLSCLALGAVLGAVYVCWRIALCNDVKYQRFLENCRGMRQKAEPLRTSWRHEVLLQEDGGDSE